MELLGRAGRMGWLAAGAATTVAVGLLVGRGVDGQVIGFRAGEPARRQPAPAAESLPASDIIEPDAFALLTGPRPDFAVKAAGTAGPAAAGAGETPRWSTLIAGATLADEVKRCLPPLQEATSSQTAFNSQVAITVDRFSQVAVAFGLMAVYDKPNDLRSSWRAAAAGLRDRFARAAGHCDRDGAKAFPEARSRTDDLAALIRGETLPDEAADGQAFQWSQLCDRAVLMRRLEAADGFLTRGTASPETFAAEAEQLLHDAELVAVLGAVMVQEAFTDWDDDTYRGYASEMQQAALALRQAVQEGDEGAARTAAKAITQACSTCHGDYR